MTAILLSTFKVIFFDWEQSSFPACDLPAKYYWLHQHKMMTSMIWIMATSFHLSADLVTCECLYVIHGLKINKLNYNSLWLTAWTLLVPISTRYSLFMGQGAQPQWTIFSRDNQFSESSSLAGHPMTWRYMLFKRLDETGNSWTILW